MKITIQPSQPRDGQRHEFVTVSIEIPDDHLTLHEVIEEMIKPSLISWGFHPENVEKSLNL
jgi:hypothetical protein